MPTSRYQPARCTARRSAGFSETYTYRAADSKLESVETDIDVTGVHSGSYTRTFGYDAYGNLTSKTSNVSNDLDVTGYAYGISGKPHRLAIVTIGTVVNTLTYDANGSITRYDAAGTLRVISDVTGPGRGLSIPRSDLRPDRTTAAAADLGSALTPGLHPIAW